MCSAENVKGKANKWMHLTAIPLRSMAASDPVVMLHWTKHGTVLQ